MTLLGLVTNMKPACPYFGACGGCAYQHLPYEEELLLKENQLRELVRNELGISNGVFRPLVPSPAPYGYRSRLDLSLRRTREGMRMGFMTEGTHRLIDIESCAISRPEISGFLPTLKRLASERLPEGYRSANLAVKVGDEGKVRWGGIGRRSLRLSEAEYFWTEIEGKRIFYSLDSFFQVNLRILPVLIERLRELLELTPETHLLDLYAGVGLFWTVFAPEVRAVWAVEESGSAMRVAEFNRRFHQLSNVFLLRQRTEDCLEGILVELEGKQQAAIVDPPRRGLGSASLEKLVQARTFNPLIYISCHPPSLVRDLRTFLAQGWTVDRIVPFDFFPRTGHLESVVRLRLPTESK